jgi:hypothetical protein
MKKIDREITHNLCERVLERVWKRATTMPSVLHPGLYYARSLSEWMRQRNVLGS